MKKKYGNYGFGLIAACLAQSAQAYLDPYSRYERELGITKSEQLARAEHEMESEIYDIMARRMPKCAGVPMGVTHLCSFMRKGAIEFIEGRAERGAPYRYYPAL
jgi:hypothetical protein